MSVRRFNRLAVLLLVVVVAAPRLYRAGAAAAAGKGSGVEESLFTNDSVLAIEIEISNKAMATLRQYEWHRGTKPSDRTPVSATVREGANVFTNVALHLKGSVGSFRPVDDKPGFTLHFDKSAKGQRFHGLQKLSLNNSVQDPSYITDKLCSEVFEKAGVPAPRAAHATVSLNGRPLGLYVLTEGWNKQFLKRHFKNTKGNLYDGGFVQDITGPMLVNSGANPDDHSDLKPLIAACRERDLANRLVRLEKVLDLDRFITFIVLDALLWNWDGYSLNRNNYRLFHDLGSDRFVFFPHGMDQMFWNPEGPIMPGMKGLVARSVMQIPECRRRYLDRATQLIGTICQPQILTNRVDALARKLVPAQSETGGWGTALRGIFQPNPVKDLKNRIVKRSENLEAQLSGIKTILVFDETGASSLSGWKTNVKSGLLNFDAAKAKPASLHLSARQEGSTGGWRTTVWLEEGRYQVTGKVRVRGVATGDSSSGRSGAGFHVFSHRKRNIGVEWEWFPFRESYDLEKRGEMVPNLGRGKAPEQRLLGDSDWVELSYDFDLRQPAADLEISCELHADQGEAWFDLSSLKILRK